MGNWFSDKYAEGTIGRRFYAGCRNVDTVESVAAEHAREPFGAPHAYVQPHSGINANLVAYWDILAERMEAPALAKAQARQVNDLSPADWAQLRQELGNQRMLGMSLDAGGHLTHGFRPNIFGHRNMRRLNWLGVSRCRLLKVDGLDLHVEDLDAVDGTPVLDIKPWFAEFGPRGEIHQSNWSAAMLRDYFAPKRE
jgi:glycine/serine hydroxymethyltransferase